MSKRKNQSSNTGGAKDNAEDAPPPPAKRRRTNKPSGMERKDALAKRMKLWTSSTYDHFITPPEIRYEHKLGRDVEMHWFQCKRDPSTGCSRQVGDSSSSNLVKHKKGCSRSPEVSAEGDAIQSYAHGRSYTPEGLRLLLVKWMTSCSRPYAIVQDEPFIQIVKMLYDNPKLVTAKTVSSDVQKVFHLARESVVKHLQDHNGLIHISCDGWSSPNVLSFLGVIAHWTSGGKMNHVLLDFIRLDRNHTGQYLAEKLLECLKAYKIEKKILGIACDNANNNTKMLQVLAEHEPSFKGKAAQVRCLCHILNLIVKAMLSQFYSKTIAAATIVTEQRTGHGQPISVTDNAEDFDLAGEKEVELAAITKEMEEESDDESVDDLEVDQDNFDQSLVEEVNKQVSNEVYSPRSSSVVIQFHLSKKDIIQGRFAITKLVALSKKIFKNAVLRSDLASACVESGIKEKVLIRPVATRWSSLLQVITRAIDLRKPLRLLCNLSSHNGRSGTPLSKLYPSDEEWTLLEQLIPLLKIFEKISTGLQKTDTPAFPKTLPLFEFLTATLESFIKDTELFPAIRAASKRGLTMVEKYARLCEDSLLPRLAIILHPRFKLEWFRDNHWPGSSVDKAVNSLRDIWISQYKSTNNQAATAPMAPEAIAPKSQPSFEEYYMKNLQIVDDELTAYLASPPDLTVDDPIEYWSKCSGDLARMGMDICGCPATSTDVERAFSGGRLTVSRMRHSLSSESTRASTVLGSWVKADGLLPEQELLKAFRSQRWVAHQESITILDD